MSARLLILRHAERPPIPDGEVGAELSLTAAGRAAARAFGHALGDAPTAILSSPVRRCLETAEQIALGSGFPASGIARSTLLGDPGVFIDDGALAWKRWQEVGHDAVCWEIALAPVLAPGFRSPAAATALLRDAVNEALSGVAGTVLWVTHDVILAGAASRLYGIDPLGANWPQYLGRLEIARDGQGAVQAGWRPAWKG